MSFSGQPLCGGRLSDLAALITITVLELAVDPVAIVTLTSPSTIAVLVKPLLAETPAVAVSLLRPGHSLSLSGGRLCVHVCRSSLVLDEIARPVSSAELVTVGEFAQPIPVVVPVGESSEPPRVPVSIVIPVGEAPVTVWAGESSDLARVLISTTVAVAVAEPSIPIGKSPIPVRAGERTDLPHVLITVAVTKATVTIAETSVVILIAVPVAELTPVVILRIVNGPAHGLPEVRGPVLLGRFLTGVRSGCGCLRDRIACSMARHARTSLRPGCASASSRDTTGRAPGTGDAGRGRACPGGAASDAPGARGTGGCTARSRDSAGCTAGTGDACASAAATRDAAACTPHPGSAGRRGASTRGAASCAAGT